MKYQRLATGPVRKRFAVVGAAPSVDIDARTCELSFSSTAPVDTQFGEEILSHAPGAADLTRLNSGAPLLFNHDRDDILGVVEEAYIVGNQGRAIVRFGKDDRGEWAMQQAADGVLVNVSFAYRVTAYRDQVDGSVIADKWEALEISLVTVPADKSVGIGRSLNFKGNSNMHEFQEPRLSRNQRQQQSVQFASEQVRAASDIERERMLEIAAMGRRFSLPDAQVQDMQRSGVSVEDARARTLEFTQSQRRRAEPAVNFSEGDIGLSDNEVSGFSLVRAINASLNNDWSGAGLERAASKAVEHQTRRGTRGFFVPQEVMRRGQWSQRAGYQVGGQNPGSTGAALVETTLSTDHFIEVLRNSAVVAQAGATVLSGLVGNIDLPRQTSQTASYWVDESQGITESEGTFDALSLRPKTLGALSRMSRLMLLQSTPAIEMLCRADMIGALGLGIDLAALSGGGGVQPTGIANAMGVGWMMLGANGANVTMDVPLAMETTLNAYNGSMNGRAYVMNAKTAGTLKGLKSSTGQYLWTDSATGGRSATPSSFNGYPVFVTNQARGNLTKGTSAGICSELFFGAWPDLVIAQWGPLEVVANPFSAAGFPSGDVLIRAMQTVDIGVRHSASFVTVSDALTP